MGQVGQVGQMGQMDGSPLSFSPSRGEAGCAKKLRGTDGTKRIKGIK